MLLPSSFATPTDSQVIPWGLQIFHFANMRYFSDDGFGGISRYAEINPPIGRSPGSGFAPHALARGGVSSSHAKYFSPIAFLLTATFPATSRWNFLTSAGHSPSFGVILTVKGFHTTSTYCDERTSWSERPSSRACSQTASVRRLGRTTVLSAGGTGADVLFGACPRAAVGASH